MPSRILIVDDDPALLEALPDNIRTRIPDLVIDTADSGTRALMLIAKHDYDAIVTDIKMPEMDGLSLLEKVRQVRPGTPTLLITGHGERDLAVRALRGGAYDFIKNRSSGIISSPRSAARSKRASSSVRWKNKKKRWLVTPGSWNRWSKNVRANC